MFDIDSLLYILIVGCIPIRPCFLGLALRLDEEDDELEVEAEELLEDDDAIISVLSISSWPSSPVGDRSRCRGDTTSPH